MWQAVTLEKSEVLHSVYFTNAEAAVNLFGHVAAWGICCPNLRF
jgi:hypothetical protein